MTISHEVVSAVATYAAVAHTFEHFLTKTRFGSLYGWITALVMGFFAIIVLWATKARR